MKIKIAIIAFLGMLLIFAGVFGYSFLKNYSVALNSTLGNECAYMINDAVSKAIAETGNLTEILHVEKNEVGVISYVSVDPVLLNRLTLSTVDRLKDEMTGLQNIPLSIPIGNMTGWALLAGRGPELKAEAFPRGGIDIDYETELREAGINQVHFHLDMNVSTEMETVFGLRHFYQKIERKVAVCDIVIVGDIPETYANLPAETDFLNLVP